MAYAGCDPKNVDEVVNVILENVARLQGTEQDMQPGWFERSKKLMITADAMERETPAAQAQSAAIFELLGLGYDYPDHFADRINGVSIDQVRQVARSHLSRCVVTITTTAPEQVTLKPGERWFKVFSPVNLTPRGVQHDAAK
mgnify:CR=1 FL=1